MVKIQRYMSEDEIFEEYPNMQFRLILDDETTYLPDGGYKNVWVEDAFASDKELASIIDSERDAMIEFNKTSGKKYAWHSSSRDSSPYVC